MSTCKIRQAKRLYQLYLVAFRLTALIQFAVSRATNIDDTCAAPGMGIRQFYSALLTFAG